MNFATIKERWTGRVAELVIGCGDNTVKIGGENTLPFLYFEGELPNKPAAALEVWDIEPENWPHLLKAPFDGVMGDPARWAEKCVEYGARVICLRLAGTHPDSGDRTPAAAAAAARSVAEAVELPLIVIGCGIEEKDALVLPEVSRALAGKNVLLGCATANNYAALAGACMADGHSLIATTPLDINLAKQLNILINESGLPLHRIAIDPLVGPLGYGIEYAYSIIERIRLSALNGDKMLAMPVVCFVGYETWKTREARSEENVEWGALEKRAVLWEAVTAAALAQAGGSAFVMCHPESVAHFNRHVNSLTDPVPDNDS